MRLAIMIPGEVACLLCRWRNTAQTVEEREKSLLRHLEFMHDRLPRMICKTEVPKRAGDSDTEPRFEYSGPNWRGVSREVRF